MYARSETTLHKMLVTGLEIALPILFIFGIGWPIHGFAATAPTALQAVLDAGRVTLDAGESIVLAVNDVVRVAVAEPKIADVAAMGRTEVLVSARTPGETTLHIWDKTGLSSFTVRVLENTADTVDELKARIGLPGVEPWMRQDTVVLEGWVQTAAERQRAAQVAAAYGKVVDLLNVRPPEPEPAADGVVAADAAPDAADPKLVEAAKLDELREVMAEPDVVLRVVNGNLLLSGYVRDAQSQERIRKVATLYYPQVTDVTQVRAATAPQGGWPVEVYRITEKAVVQVDK